jgi:GT2 family glycosyltransferase
MTRAPVTTAVITRNRWPNLTRTLARHEAPVVVVDNGSTDGTPDLVAAHHPEVDLVRLDRNRGALARNEAVRRARTPYVAFADDDSWWAPGALAHAAEVMDDHPRLALLAARVLVGEEERLDPTSGLMSRAPLGRADDLPGPSVLGFVACGAVVRRDAFLAAGGFDGVVVFYGEEDRLAWDLADAGWGLAYVDSVVAHHDPAAVERGGSAGRRLTRNGLLTAVMRRPWPVVAGQVAGALRQGPQERRGLLDAMARSHLALARRRTVSPPVEAALRRLERSATSRS